MRSFPRPSSLVLLASLSAPAAAQVVAAPLGPHAFKVNGTLAQQAGTSDVLDYVVAEDGSWVAYRAGSSAAGWELFAAPLDGSAPAVRLNDPLPAGGNVAGSSIHAFGAGGQMDFLFAADTGLVAFVADAFSSGQVELFSVPADRSAAPVHLSAGVPFGEVRSFALSADGELAVFLAGTNENSAFYRVPTDGSAPATAFTDHTWKGFTWWLAPDGSRVLFTEELSSVRTSLYRVPTDGSQAPALVAQSPQPTSQFGSSSYLEVLFADDGTYIVANEYVEENGFATNRSNVLSATLDGSSPPLRLNLARITGIAYDGGSRVAFVSPAEGGAVTIGLDGSQRVVLGGLPWTANGEPMLTEDGARVVFVAGNGGSSRVLVGPLDGSAPAQVLAESSESIGLFGLTSTTVVYVQSIFSTPPNLFAVPLAGGTPVVLDPPTHVLGAVRALHPGGHVVYSADRNATGVLELFRAPLDGSSAPVRLSDPMPSFADVTHAAVAGSGARVVYLADRFANETFELFGAPFEGGLDVRYNSPFPSGPVLGDVERFWVGAGEQRVVYHADQDQDGVRGLYAAGVDGGAPFSLTLGLPEGRSVFDAVALSPDGTRAAFLRANSAGSAAGDLYVADTTQPGVPTLLDDASGMHETPLLASSTRVAYRRQVGLFGPYQLCSARLDATGSPLALSPPSGTVTEFLLAPDGATAFYLADLTSAGVVELHGTPMDGSAPSARLNPPLGGASDVLGFAVSPTGAHVVYRADAEVDEQVELWSVPSGGGAAVELNAPLAAAGDVTGFVVTSDGAHVVYRATPGASGGELFRVPIGGGAAVLLTPMSGSDAVQPDFVVSADSQSVYYRALDAAANELELHHVGADGGSPPVRISGALVAGGNVSSFALAPDQSRVVYVADQRTNDVLELFSAGATAGTDVLLLGLPATSDAMQFRIAPDSRSVVCRADQTDGVFELFEMPLDGSASPRRLNAPLPSGGDVETDFAALSRGRALYRADHEENNVIELWRASHGPRVRGGKPRAVVRALDSRARTESWVAATADGPAPGMRTIGRAARPRLRRRPGAVAASREVA